MNDSQIRNLIREMVRTELPAIMMATIEENASQSRSTVRRFSSDGPLPNLRSIQPYGISSRAPSGKSALIAPAGHDATHLNVLGHFDQTRPTVEDGEIKLYNEFGDVIYVKQGSIISTTPAYLVESDNIKLGSNSASENFVLGQVFKTFMSQVLQLISSHVHIGSLPGFPTGAPTNAAQFTNLKSSPIDDEEILSNKIFGEKGA